MSMKMTGDRRETLTHRRFIRTMGGGVAVAFAVVGLAACGDDGNDGTSPFARIPGGPAAEAAPAEEPAAVEVIIIPEAWDPTNADIAFSPNVVTVKVGDTVTWSNTDTLFHTVISGTSTGEPGKTGTPDGLFDSGEVQAGELFERTFDEAGTFTYFCTPHPWMIGEVIVTG